MFKKKADGEYAFSARFWTYAAIATLIIAWIGWRTQATANKVEHQATLTSECLSQVISSLDARTKINAENDNLSQAQREAFGEVLRALVAPPQPINGYDVTDPRRQEYVNKVVSDQFAVFQKTQAQQDQNEVDRTLHPYSPADCALLSANGG